MFEMVKHSEDLGELFAALVKVQAQIPHASKSAENPFFKSGYADLPELLDTARPIATANGIAVVQLPTGKGGLMTIIGHESGQYVMGYMEMVPADNKPQTYGSCLTYERRYSYAAALGIAQDDDDGNAASGKVFNMDEKRSQEWLAEVMKRLNLDSDLKGVLSKAMHNRPLSEIGKVAKNFEAP